MKIYEPRTSTDGTGNDVHCLLTFVDMPEIRRFGMGEDFRGQPMPAENLQPYRVKRSTEFPGGDTAPLGDRQGVGFNIDPMALSRRALDVLLPHIGHLVQVVPLEFDEGEYALLNVVNVIDALDVERSDIELFPSSGRVSRIKRYAFNPQAVHGQWIFKIKQTQSQAFVTDKFVDLVTQAGLTGFDFEALWSDEPATQEAGA